MNQIAQTVNSKELTVFHLFNKVFPLRRSVLKFDLQNIELRTLNNFASLSAMKSVKDKEATPSASFQDSSQLTPIEVDYDDKGMMLTIFRTVSNSGSPVITGRFISFASSIQKASA